jgi:hypothetical protein
VDENIEEDKIDINFNNEMENPEEYPQILLQNLNLEEENKFKDISLRECV